MRVMFTVSMLALLMAAPQVWAQDYGVQAPQVEIIKNDRLNDLTKLPGYRVNAFTEELEKELATNKELYGELMKSPEVLRKLMRRRDLHSYVARGQLSVEDLRKRFKVTIKGREELQEWQEEVEKKIENSPATRLKNQKINVNRQIR